MLDTDTKRRIDTCRDILVGKVPDPKSQVEQITIALIYKFMDDMDSENEEVGGKRSFFAGQFAKYRWSALLAPGMGGFDTLTRYTEAIARISENPGIPPLFRDIFKNAYLPYRDPETLRAFLKEIDGFRYDHSERLGDAFEYLLSVLGSQGDAGQFRTPRHLIDFMVALVDPKKDETILDPACGTAGFLISAWKHVRAANSIERPGDRLTASERRFIADAIRGYDISPDMVRLSLVNLYLHGFRTPHVFEYDTLTSEDRWGEYFDIILANPPFMSPKVGIRPHKRFSVQSKRSEVLFVDYMAEHLTTRGRAAIIVPEGIIFQSQNAYRQLRKMLVEKYLVAVVSLPAGCFNPYSGVKTSILLLDKQLAKRADDVLFVKVENDGFGLGAQRRKIEKDDLPQARTEITEYLRGLRAGEGMEGFEPTLGRVVKKERIGAGGKDGKDGKIGEWNLSGERYGEDEVRRTHVFPLVRIGDVCIINPRKSQLADLPSDTRVSFVPMADLNEHRIAFYPSGEKSLLELSANYTYFGNNDVLLAKVTPCFENGKAGISRDLLNGIGFGSSEFYVLRTNNRVLSEWIYFCVMHPFFREAAIAQMTGTGGLQRVPRNYVENFRIPLPPLSVQQEIVAEIEGYQKVIDGARQVLENYRPHIHVDPEWPVVELGNACENLDSKRVPITKGDRKEGEYPYYGASGIVDYVDDYIFNEDLLLISEDGANLLARNTPIAFSVSGKIWVNNHAHVLRFKETAAQKFVETYINSIPIDSYVTGAAQPKLNQQALNSISIPLPPLPTQHALVAEIQEEQRLVAANRELIRRFEEKIQKTIDRVWGKAE
uniref:site-specific DNA-methyltransferase (adenine-specific) n=1 Tax=Candidatus Kentrum sp. DK TaxID=2126562 RepID=A0A450S7M2_9GAMM|nr:MAG: type I restriction enzyme M protein [Candidatus Kentron sp. DK]